MKRLEHWLADRNEQDREAGVSRSHKVVRRVGMPLAAAALTTAVAVSTDKLVVSAEQGPHPIDTTRTYREVTARPGDTLFGLAEQAEPSKDPRAVVDSIVATIERRDHVSDVQAEQLLPGEIVPLPADAQIGQLVQPAGEAPR